MYTMADGGLLYWMQKIKRINIRNGYEKSRPHVYVIYVINEVNKAVLVIITHAESLMNLQKNLHTCFVNYTDVCAGNEKIRFFFRDI